MRDQDELLGDEDVGRALELADGHLEEAENVLWMSSRSTSSDRLTDELVELTRQVWDLQHDLTDLRRELD